MLGTVILTEDNLQHVVKEIKGHKHLVAGALFLVRDDSPSQRSSLHTDR